MNSNFHSHGFQVSLNAGFHFYASFLCYFASSESFVKIFASLLHGFPSFHDYYYYYYLFRVLVNDEWFLQIRALPHLDLN